MKANMDGEWQMSGWTTRAQVTTYPRFVHACVVPTLPMMQLEQVGVMVQGSVVMSHACWYLPGLMGGHKKRHASRGPILTGRPKLFWGYLPHKVVRTDVDTVTEMNVYGPFVVACRDGDLSTVRAKLVEGTHLKAQLEQKQDQEQTQEQEQKHDHDHDHDHEGEGFCEEVEAMTLAMQVQDMMFDVSFGLVAAIQHNQLEVVREIRAHFPKESWSRSSLMQWACTAGHLPIILELLSWKTMKDHSPDTWLRLVTGHHTATLQALVERKLFPAHAVNECMMEACHGGMFDIAHILKKSGMPYDRKQAAVHSRDFVLRGRKKLSPMPFPNTMQTCT
jgi:hypothetical protein